MLLRKTKGREQFAVMIIRWDVFPFREGSSDRPLQNTEMYRKSNTPFQRLGLIHEA